MAELKFRPILGTKKDLGVYRKDLEELGVKEGDWVGIRYGGKEISNSVRAVGQETGWKDRLVWISEDDAKGLEIVNYISNLGPNNPKDGLEVTVWKHTFPRDKKLYFAIFSTIIAVLATLFTAVVQADMYPDHNIILGASALVLTIITIVSTAAVTVVLKQ